MKKYKIVGSSDSTFMGIEMNFMFEDLSIGKSCEVFGKKFTITQTGTVVTLANKDWVLTLQELPESKKEKWDKMITNENHLRVNYEVDVFLKTKLIKLSETDRLHKDNGVTLLALYKFLRKEWKYIKASVNVDFPFDYDAKNKIFIMKDEWNFDSLDSISLFREGSFSRFNSSGRCI